MSGAGPGGERGGKVSAVVVMHTEMIIVKVQKFTCMGLTTASFPYFSFLPSSQSQLLL